MNQILLELLAEERSSGHKRRDAGGLCPDASESLEPEHIAPNPPKKTPKMILVFDTETSGLFPKCTESSFGESEPVDPNIYPYILQLCFILYDTQSQKIIHKYNKYIKVPEHVTISPFITNLTGITREMCNAGVSISSALHEFYCAYKLCDSIVAHNISFDRQMIELEIIRYYNVLMRIGKTPKTIAFMFHSIYQRLNNKQMYCTMAMGRNICNLIVIQKTNPDKSYKKNPKLGELYEHLFKEKLPNAHDALFDTMACLRCFVMMSEGRDLGDIGNTEGLVPNKSGVGGV